MNLKIEKIDYHRNGISGQGFYVVLFDDYEEKRKMVATISSDSMKENEFNTYCFVLDIGLLAKGVIEMGSNSWRGDYYLHGLKPLMKDAWKKNHDYELSFDD